jgi:hypothetical protein
MRYARVAKIHKLAVNRAFFFAVKVIIHFVQNDSGEHGKFGLDYRPSHGVPNEALTTRCLKSSGF